MAKTYTTIQGDAWDVVSLKMYGTEKRMGELIEANPTYRETTVFPAGIVLAVPDVSTAVNQKLPPWKRGTD